MLTQIALLFGLVTSTAHADLTTVPYVDVQRYLGTWYQISRNPLGFEKGCVCSRQMLTANTDGTVAVYNSCNYQTPEGALLEIRGTATNVDPTTNARFTVDFGLPKTGNYWVIGLDSEYRYAVVSDPSLASLYVLSKTPELAAELYDKAVVDAGLQIDTSKLEKTLQSGCTYP